MSGPTITEGPEVVCDKGAIAAGPERAAQVGAQILAAGGNAIDGVVAAGIAGCLLAPRAAGLAGYIGCAVVRPGPRHAGQAGGEADEVWSVDGNSVAPAAAREDMFETAALTAVPNTDHHTVYQQSHGLNEAEYFCTVKDDANVLGPLSVGVPGVMACLGEMSERWGRLPWADVVAPSQAMLADGVQVIGPDDVAHRPGLAATLARLAEAGWRDMYTGELGQAIADAVQDAGGILTRDDMRAYSARVTPACATTYRGATVHCPTLPHGGLSCLQALNMLEGLPLHPPSDARYWHALAEVLKLVWRDRLEYLADPDFADVPAERLLSKDYAAGRVETLRRFPGHVDRLAVGPPLEADGDTFHISGADHEGNLVSMTLSHGSNFGSRFVVPGTDLVLGHGMCRLDPRPGQLNSIAPGKRPLNNTCAMILRMPERDIAIGMPGGRRIISISPQFVQRLVDFGATGLEAITAPRLHVSIQEPVEIMRPVGDTILQQMVAIGHEVKATEQLGGMAHCAELLHQNGRIRASGNSWAAGI